MYIVYKIDNDTLANIMLHARLGVQAHGSDPDIFADARYLTCSDLLPNLEVSQ